MAASHVPMIIVLALGAGALGFPDALHLLLEIPKRSPLADIAICVLAMSVVTTQALGAMLLARFIRKTAPRAGVDAHARVAPPRTDRFAQMTLAVSLGVAFVVSVCLLVASGTGARGIGLLCLPAAGIARKMKSTFVAALATAAAILPCAKPLLRVFRREEDHSHGGVAAASSSAWTGRFASKAQVASFTGAAAFLLAASGGVFAQRGSLAAVAAVVGTVLLARFTFTRKARNAAGAGVRAAPAPAADTRRFGGKLTRLVPYLAVVSLAVISCVVLTNLTAPRTHDFA